MENKISIKKKGKIKFGLKEKLVVIMVLVGVIPISTLTIISSVSYSNDSKETWLNNLDAIGEGKHDFIYEWFHAKRDNLLSFSLDDQFKIYAKSLDSNSANTTSQIAIQQNFQATITAVGEYTEIYLLDTDGIIVAQVNATGWEDGHAVWVRIKGAKNTSLHVKIILLYKNTLLFLICDFLLAENIYN